MVRSNLVFVFGLIVSLFVISCSSPGEPFAYKDLKLSVGPSATPATPATTHAITINFTIRNTWNQAMDNVPWELHLTASNPTVVGATLVASGIVSIPAFGSIAQTAALGTLAKGSRTYEIRLDPANAFTEDNEANNIGQVSILVADQDISFGVPAPTITVNAGTPPSSQNLTATFAIQHTVNTTAPAPAAVAINVPYSITLNGAVIAPLSASIASPANVNPAGTNPLSITLTLPATGSAGSFPYVITLSPAAGDDNNINNNTVTVVVNIPAPG
jgi:hypothetical protein